MTLILLVKALVMGVVEGLTEFLPVSSTGHLILVGSLLSINSDEGKLFEIVIQTGAILAIVWFYRAKLLDVVRGLAKYRRSERFVMNLAIAFMPAAVLGLLFGSDIKVYLFKPLPVAIALIVGGIIILIVERFPHAVTVETVDDMRAIHAFKVGCAQCLALIPGTSRSGATIIGGLLSGLSRQAAAEFSFFLAIPTLMAAGAYDMYKARDILSVAGGVWIAVGFAAAFVSALLCVRWFLGYISRHDFTLFAWYRIVLGLVVIGSAYAGLRWTME